MQGIPEQIAVTTLAFVIAKMPLKWNRIALIGTGLAFSAYVVRLFPIPFGIHTILLILLLFLLLTKFGGDISLSLIASLISVLAVIILETVCISFLMSFFGVSMETFLTDSITRILILLPQIIGLFILAFIVKKYTKRGEPG